jgi:hypothetical protein
MLNVVMLSVVSPMGHPVNHGLWFVELRVCQIHCSYAQIIFPIGFAIQGVLNKDLTVWLDGAKPPLNSQFNELSPYE